MSAMTAWGWGLMIVGLILIIIMAIILAVTYSGTSKPTWAYVVLIIGIVLFVLGIILLIWGYGYPSDEVVAETKVVRRTVTTEKTPMM